MEAKRLIYCPICKTGAAIRNNDNDNIYECLDCESIFKFYGENLEKIELLYTRND